MPVQPEDGSAALEDEQRRLERFKKYDPPIFSGLALDDALGFLKECHRIIRTMASGTAYKWWRTYEIDSPNEAASLTWTHFLDMFMREFVPQSLKDAWRAEFEHFCQGVMTVSKYAIRYTRLDRHAPALVAIVRERVRRFIEGLTPPIRSSMARELEMDISYQQVVSITRRIEVMLTREREEREAKRSRESVHYSGAHTPVVGRYGRGYMGRPVHSPPPTASSALAPPRAQEPYYAPSVSSAPPTRGAFRGQSRRVGPSQSQPPRPPRACFECDDTCHMVRDCPRLRRGAPS
ncbi:uncharacterized protein [Nicotiana sylvestris]|uniref:uncharacterized protein n=1 Tax=Nicotiana sylvestris TaxID=4096 RepID=UPI00388CBAAE